MLQYVVAGLVLGGIYAIVASGLVVTYQSSRDPNFGFGAIAYTIARFYYFLNSQHAWPILPAALLSILVLGPLIGLVFYIGLFQFMHLSSTLIKVLATVGISVGLPALDNVIFGTQEILSAPGLAPLPVHVYQFLGVAVTLDQVIVYACVVTIMVVGFVVLRYTGGRFTDPCARGFPGNDLFVGHQPRKDVGGGVGREQCSSRALWDPGGTDHWLGRRGYDAGHGSGIGRGDRGEASKSARGCRYWARYGDP